MWYFRVKREYLRKDIFGRGLDFVGEGVVWFLDSKVGWFR